MLRALTGLWTAASRTRGWTSRIRARRNPDRTDCYLWDATLMSRPMSNHHGRPGAARPSSDGPEQASAATEPACAPPKETLRRSPPGAT